MKFKYSRKWLRDYIEGFDGAEGGWTIGVTDKITEFATKSQSTPCYICESSPCVCKEKDIENKKECTTCGHLKVSSPTPDGDEICPSCGGDCMDCESSLNKQFDNPMDQLNELVEQAKQFTKNYKNTSGKVDGNADKPSPVERLNYSLNPNTLDIKLFGIGDPISIIVQKLDQTIVELNKLIVNNTK